jgi:hypothetical protein
MPLREADFEHEVGEACVGSNGIEHEVGPGGNEQGVVFLTCDAEPLAGMILVAQLGVQGGDLDRRNVTGFGFALGEFNLDSFT